MIKPAQNARAAEILMTRLFFPSIRFLRRPDLARRCWALIEADRYLTACERKP